MVDLFMPEKNGLETIVELRDHTPGVSVIAISAVGSERLDLLNDARMLGAVETLAKPFSRHALLAMVARLLANVG